MGQVTALPGGQLPVKQVMDGALKQDFKDIIIMGTLEDGNFFLASSKGKISEIHYTVSLVAHKLLAGDFSE